MWIHEYGSSGSLYPWCTAAFAVRKDNKDMMMSAAHCINGAPNQADWYNGPVSSQSIVVCDNANLNGSLIIRGRDTALLVIDGPGACDTGDIDNVWYGGNWNDGTPLREVDGVNASTAELSLQDQLIKTSGSRTGELLLVVSDNGLGWEFPCDEDWDPDEFCDGVKSERRHTEPSSIASAVGDSGGPVGRTRTLTDGTKLVAPLGTISAVGDGLDSVSCNQEGSKDEVRGDDAQATIDGDCGLYMYYMQVKPLLAAGVWNAVIIGP